MTIRIMLTKKIIMIIYNGRRKLARKDNKNKIDNNNDHDTDN